MFFRKLFLNLLPLGFLSFLDINQNPKYNEGQQDDNDNYIKVAVLDDKAYWVFQNTLYEADVVDDEVVKEDARPVDAFDMHFEQVKELMELLDEMENWTE